MGLKGGIDVLFYVIVSFVHRDRPNQQQQIFDTFSGPAVVNAQGVIRSKNIQKQE